MQKTARTLLFITPILLLIFCKFPQEPERFNHRPSQMKLIPGGSFLMGTVDSTLDYGAQPPHMVTMDAFYMDSTEVTQDEYFNYMEYNNPSYMAFLHNPVENVTWFDAVLFCNARSKRDHRFDTVYSYTSALSMEIPTGTRCTSLTNLKIDYSKKGYRLPTEAEFEYACRAGTTTQCFWGSQKSQDTVDMFCWFSYNGMRKPQIVALKLPNPWGLYDIIGNVQEWCNDWYQVGYDVTKTNNPIGPDDGTKRVNRGGAYDGNNTTGSLARSASRKSLAPNKYSQTIGFRCVLPVQ